MNRLVALIAILTGGDVGIGCACVRRMAEEGAKVAIFDVRKAEGKSLAFELTSKGFDVAFWPVNVVDEAAVKTAMDAPATQFGGLHVIVNNAGITGSPKPMDQVTEEEWDRVQAVNVKGGVLRHKASGSSSAGRWPRFDHQPLLHRRADRGGRHRALPRLEGSGAADVEKMTPSPTRPKRSR